MIFGTLRRNSEGLVIKNVLTVCKKSIPAQYTIAKQSKTVIPQRPLFKAFAGLL
jgi:hypothetical protein